MKKLPVAIAMAVIALVLGGCAMQPESRLDEFLTQSEALALETAELAPQDPPGTIVEEGAEARTGDTSSAEDKPSDPAWAQARARVDYGVVSGVSEVAVGAISDSLTADGWTGSRVREIDGQVTEGFRKTIDGGGWYVEVVWVRAAPELNESVKILVVSPDTTRGDTQVP